MKLLLDENLSHRLIPLVGNAGTDAVADLLLRSHDRLAGFVERPEDALLTLRAGDSPPDQAHE